MWYWTPERSLVAQRPRRSLFSMSSGPYSYVAYTSWTQEDAGSENQPDPEARPWHSLFSTKPGSTCEWVFAPWRETVVRP
jgi:hypothetical protein